MSDLLSHLRDHKFKLDFQDTLNPLCICGKTLKQHLITFSTITNSPMKDALIFFFFVFFFFFFFLTIAVYSKNEY